MRSESLVLNDQPCRCAKLVVRARSNARCSINENELTSISRRHTWVTKILNDSVLCSIVRTVNQFTSNSVLISFMVGGEIIIV